MQGLSRRQRREVNRAVRDGRAVRDPALMAVTLSQAQYVQRFTRLTMASLGGRLVIAGMFCLWLGGLLVSVDRRQPGWVGLAAVLLVATACIPALGRRREERSARAMHANGSAGGT